MLGPITLSLVGHCRFPHHARNPACAYAWEGERSREEQEGGYNESDAFLNLKARLFCRQFWKGREMV